MDRFASQGTIPANLYAGRKGIGRFSCDKLGETLDLYTRITKSEPWNHLVVDWNKFQSAPDKDFQEIPVAISQQAETVEAAGNLERGTVLLIGKLREEWDYESVLRLKRYLQKLLDPLSPARENAFNIIIDAPHLLDEERKRISKHPSDQVNGAVHTTLFHELQSFATKMSVSLRSGKLVTTLLDKGVQLYKLEEVVEGLKFVEEVDCDIFYLDRRAKGLFTRRIGIEPVKYGSIFLYRNGIRVFPYGEPTDDWLMLNRRKQQGYRRFLSSRELLGRVSLKDTKGIWEEASSRDSGIKDSDAKDELTDFILKKVIMRLEKYIVEASEWNIPSTEEERASRNSKVIELLAGMSIGDKNILSVEYSDSLTEAVRDKGAQESLSAIEELSGELDPEKRKTIARYLASFRSFYEAAESEATIAQQEATFLKSASDSVRTGTLQLIAEHNLNIIAKKLQPRLIEIGNYIKSRNLPTEFIEAIEDAIKDLELLKERNKLVIRASWDVSKEVEVNIPSFIKEYVGQYWVRSLEKSGISVAMQGVATPFKRKMQPEVLCFIVDTLIDNARKADPYNILISFTEDQSSLTISFSDDGNGVPEVGIPNLFVPWSSTTGGSGIGLYTSRNLLKTVGGQLRFVGNGCKKNMKGACFEVVF